MTLWIAINGNGWIEKVFVTREAATNWLVAQDGWVGKFITVEADGLWKIGDGIIDI